MIIDMKSIIMKLYLNQKREKIVIYTLCAILVILTFYGLRRSRPITAKKSELNTISCKLLNYLSPPVNDFVNFPCLKYVTPSEGQIKYGRCVRTIKLPKALLSDPTGCVTLKFGLGTPICTYPPEEDIHVSRAIVTKGYWEKEFVLPMQTILRKNPGMAFLDLGCNIGVYTLSAAQITNRVFCVDANFENLYLVSKSLTQGNLSRNVTLVWNAVSNNHQPVILRKQNENVGGAEIDAKNTTTMGCDIIVNTIVLDDLIEYFRNEQVYIKMDVQSVEHHVLRHGKEFFSVAKVRYVQLEYVMHKGLTSGKEIIAAMFEYGFKPFIDCKGSKSLDPALEFEWPGDVCFIAGHR